MTIALHHSRATGTAKLVLIGIANHDGDGGSWPSIATLARYAGVNARNTQQAIARLIKLGEVSRAVMGGGTHITPDHMRPNLYKIKLTCPLDCDRTVNHRPGGVLQRQDANPTSNPTSPAASDRRTLKTPLDQLKSDHPVLNRATPKKGHGLCGHRLVDPRHCENGCYAAKVSDL